MSNGLTLLPAVDISGGRASQVVGDGDAGDGGKGGGQDLGLVLVHREGLGDDLDLVELGEGAVEIERVEFDRGDAVREQRRLDHAGRSPLVERPLARELLGIEEVRERGGLGTA